MHEHERILVDLKLKMAWDRHGKDFDQSLTMVRISYSKNFHISFKMLCMHSPILSMYTVNTQTEIKAFSITAILRILRGDKALPKYI